MSTLRQFAAAMGLVCMVGIAASAGSASAGQFDGVTVRFGTFGGKWRDIVESYVAKAFEKEGGKIEYVLGQPANNMAKLIAARGQEPPFDLLETMDNFLPQLSAGNFTEKLDLTQLPNLSQLDKSMYDSGKVMIWITEEGIIYNRKKFAEAGIPAPKRYLDLADSRLKNKVSLPDISAGGAIPAIVGMSYEGGGSEADIGPGLELVKKIAPANFWSSSSNLQTQLVNGDVWAAAAQAGNVQRLKDKVDLGIVFPPVAQGKSGVLKQGYLVKIKGAKHTQAIEWIINQFLTKPMQVAVLTEGGQVPVHKGALAELHANPEYSFLRLSAEDFAKMYSVDFSKVNEAAYVQRWNRTIGR
jgi:putative spermidine/putrescine transport system substrate-binding protein